MQSSVLHSSSAFSRCLLSVGGAHPVPPLLWSKYTHSTVVEPVCIIIHVHNVEFYVGSKFTCKVTPEFSDSKFCMRNFITWDQGALIKQPLSRTFPLRTWGHFTSGLSSLYRPYTWVESANVWGDLPRLIINYQLTYNFPQCIYISFQPLCSVFTWKPSGVNCPMSDRWFFWRRIGPWVTHGFFLHLP